MKSSSSMNGFGSSSSSTNTMRLPGFPQHAHKNPLCQLSGKAKKVLEEKYADLVAKELVTIRLSELLKPVIADLVIHLRLGQNSLMSDNPLKVLNNVLDTPNGLIEHEAHFS